MNGYFRMSVSDRGAGITIFAPTNGGVPVGFKEISAYLDRCKIPYDVKMLNDAIVSLRSEKVTLKLTDQKTLPIAETCNITVDATRMKAIARFYPASNDGRVLDKEGVYSELRLNKIAAGYKDDLIEKYLKERQYCTDYVLAEGQHPREGKDAVITYYFDVNKVIKPRENEDGTVDYYDLGLVNHCKVGDLLAELTPEDPGDPGFDVIGSVLKPHEVKRLKLSHGLNINMSEDRRRLTSTIDGHVSLVNGKVFVSNVLELENVDLSTGNIEYQGNVVVNNNVLSNFTIKAHGDIEIRGVVEGAYLEADGNIVLSRGMNGVNKGTLKAGGNVVAKFLENCTVRAGGDVITDSILHCKVEAQNEVVVVSRKGFITGGSVCATNTVRAKNVGSPMGADTEIIVGVDPAVSARYAELEKLVEEAEKNLKVITPALDATKAKLATGARMLPDQLKSLQVLATNAKTLKENIAEYNTEMDELREKMVAGTNAKVEVAGNVYGGTTITISDAYMIVKDSFKYCRFTKEQGTVKMSPL